MAKRIIKTYANQNDTNEVTTTATTTALYVRVSTDKQADEGFSLEAQQTRLQAYCVAQGWTVDTDHIYIDAGISGKSTDSREAFNAMLDNAKAGVIGRIVAIKLDRIARNTKDFLHVVDELGEWGCDLVLIQESFDTSTPHGKFALTMFAAMAELEASMITERVMSGKAQKASQGGYNGARCPLGYEYANGEFKPTMHATTIEYIFEQWNAGKPMSHIARDLNDGGNPTARGGKWQAAQVQYILRNGFYAGLAQWNDVEASGTHPAIIHIDTYRTAINKLQNVKRGPRAK